MSELMALAGAALLYTALAMWATAPPYTCTMVPEPHRQLNLDAEVDREHFQRDVLATSRMARRYAVHLAGEMRNDNSDIDRVTDQCRDTLAREIMTMHDVTREQMLAARSAAP